MRILSLRFQNLNSLRGTHTIDLENGPLAQAGLFAITGPTGAGKSTILDAVTLALYGRAARYGRDSAEDMMSRGEGECSASVDFQCASGRFTAKWVLRRARGKPNGKLQPPVHELSQGGVILEEKIQRVLKRVEELTELDYDRFLRSVLLAQGQFAAFLNADRDQRAGLLESITGSQIYSELGSLTHYISTGHSREIENASNRMKGIVFLTEEERMKVSGRITALTDELKTLEARLTSLQSRVGAGKRAVDLQRQTEELARQTTEHAKAEEAFAPETARLELHAATERFAEELAEFAMAGRTAATTATARAAASLRATAAKEKASLAAGIALASLDAGKAQSAQQQRDVTEQLSKNTAECSSARAWLEQHQADAVVAGMLPALSALVERAGFLSLQVNTAVAGLAKARAAVTAAEETDKAAEELAATATNQSTLAHRLAERVQAAADALLPERWSTAGAIEQEVNRLAGVVETLNRLALNHAGLAEQQKKVAALFAQEAALQNTAKTLALTASQAAGSLESAKRIESLLREKVADQRRIRSLEEHRQHLQTGQPCPLCGATEHPWSRPEAVPADSAEEQLRMQTTERERLEKEMAVAREQSAAAERHLAQHHARAHAIEEGLFSARSQFEIEWRAIAPERECSGENLSSAKAEAITAHAAMTATAANIRTAQEEARTAAAAAAKATSETQLAQARRESRRVNLAASLTALNEAETALTNAQKAQEEHSTEARRAFAEAGELDAEDLPGAMERIQKRERTWRENAARTAELEKRATSLRHEQERILDTVKTWETRAAETTSLLARESIVPVTNTSQKSEWGGAFEELTGSLNAWRTTEALAVDAAGAAEQAAGSLTLRQAALTETLAGSVFDSIEALKKARLERPVLQTIHSRREALHKEALSLHTRREFLFRETETVHALLEKMQPGGTFQPADLPGLELELSGVFEQVRALHADRGAVEQRLRSDDEMRSVHAASAVALEEMKRGAAPWSRLNELIGSAHGDKFSRFAQAVTLEHLTSLANARLVQLCDRYRLLRRGRADDLELQISDAWQGDSLRPMESLSGGETFLVSLALALGLSELAGGRNKIGTLFIDEGFGTLDSTALDIALSSLETLRTGHSAIGVISHVEILKARLTTQVEVVRGAGGWAHLEVRT